MENFENNKFETNIHEEDLDFIFNQESEDLNEVIFENKTISYNLKMYFRLLRKKWNLLIRKKMQKSFTNVLYLTLDCPNFTHNSVRDDSPLEYIDEMRKQYPDNDIRVLIPILGLPEDFRPSKKMTLEINNRQRVIERTSIAFEFFLQNRIQGAIVYKFPKVISNIQVYGIYSPSFSFLKNVSELSRLQYLAPFLKSVRIAIKKFSKIDFAPDIIHCENIPYYLGGEFEVKFPSRLKVLQIIKDFTQIDIAKPEAFWAVINLADKSAMKKICNDSLIKKHIATLFNLHHTKRFYQMSECLRFIYKNYYKFRKYVDKGEDIEENIIFNRLNSRVMQIFPQISYGEDLYFNPMMYTLKKADFWATTSKTYYKEIFKIQNLSGKMFSQIEKTKNKSAYISYGCDMKKYPREDTRQIYHSFNIDNFRENRIKNKTSLIKEFAIDRIKTNFVDPTLFNDSDVKIIGYLDSFYESPLILVNPNTEIFANGVDIIFNTILKLFELHKNIQVVICIKDGLKVNFIKTWLDFLSQNKYLNGKWVFIDANIKPSKFYAGSDMVMIPRRANMTNLDHYIAMNYGCVPIVSRSGILNDTISDIFDDMANGCGLKTKTNLLTDDDVNEIYLSSILKALNLYQNNPSSWNLLIKNCLNHPSGWSFKILEKYNRIYKELVDSE